MGQVVLESVERPALVLAISEEELGADGRLQGPRRRLLQAALDNTKWLLAGGHDDPLVRDELGKVVARVERLLADQELRWDADGAFLMKDARVRAELKLAPEQTRRVDRTFPPPPPPGKGPRPPDAPLEARVELIRSLTAEQRQRLRQISLQFRGPLVFNDAEVIDALKLTYSQRQQIKMIHAEELHGLDPSRKGDPRPPSADANARATERIVEVLTPDQQESWRTLTGKPFSPKR